MMRIVNNRAGRPWASTLSRQLLWVGVTACALTCSSHAQEGSESSGNIASIEAIREGYDKYYELKKLISQEKAEWELEKEILQDRTDLVLDQIEDIETKTAEQEEEITESDKEREELQAELTDLQEVERLQLDTIVRMERTVREMVPRLPETLVAKVQPLVERLPGPDLEEEDIKLSVSQRFGNVLGILNEVNKFHADLAAVNERRSIDDGQQAEVRTLYLGISNAFYAGSGDTEKEAGIGKPDEEGWTWDKRPDIGRDIRRLIAIYENEDVAAYVPLPVQVEESTE